MGEGWKRALKAARKTRRASKRRKAPPTLAELKKTAWGLLSQVIRREAQVESQRVGIGFISCFTCGELHEWNDGMQAGHAIGGRNGAVLLDEEIIRPQCVRCNIMLRGNYPVFIHRLIREKAIQAGTETGNINAFTEAMDWWESKLQYSRQVKKWDRAELQGKIESYKARLQALGS